MFELCKLPWLFSIFAKVNEATDRFEPNELSLVVNFGLLFLISFAQVMSSLKTPANLSFFF